MRPIHTSISLCLALSVLAFAPGCALREARGVSGGGGSERTDVPGRASRPGVIEGWQSETFPLPPAFAPMLPAGEESLRFPPGWGKPESDNFWSYAFVMWIDEPAPDAARLHNLLEQYYNGLMASFAEGKGRAIVPAQVKVTRTSRQHFEAHVRVTEAFATLEPIDLRVLVETANVQAGRATLRIRVSPKPSEDAIWRSLDAAITDILLQSSGRKEQPDGTRPGV